MPHSFVYFPPCIFHIFPVCEFCSLLLCHKGTSVRLLPPPLECRYTSFLFLAGPGPLHEIAVSGFSRSLLGRANTFSFLFLLLTSRKSLKSSSSFTLFLSASLCLISIFSFTSVLYPQTCRWTVSLLGFLLYPSMLSRLRYPALFQLALLLPSPIQPSQLLLATFVFACFLLCYHHFNVFVRNGYVPSSALENCITRRT